MLLYQCYAFRLTKYVLLATEGLLSYDMRVYNKKKEKVRIKHFCVKSNAIWMPRYSFVEL